MTGISTEKKGFKIETSTTGEGLNDKLNKKKHRGNTVSHKKRLKYSVQHLFSIPFWRVKKNFSAET